RGSGRSPPRPRGPRRPPRRAGPPAPRPGGGPRGRAASGPAPCGAGPLLVTCPDIVAARTQAVTSAGPCAVSDEGDVPGEDKTSRGGDSRGMAGADRLGDVRGRLGHRPRRV